MSEKGCRHFDRFLDELWPPVNRSMLIFLLAVAKLAEIGRTATAWLPPANVMHWSEPHNFAEWCKNAQLRYMKSYLNVDRSQ